MVVALSNLNGFHNQSVYTSRPYLARPPSATSGGCNYVNSGNIRRMNWQDIATLQQDGTDIESHTMDDKPLNTLSWNALLYEITGFKDVLLTMALIHQSLHIRSTKDQIYTSH